MGWYEDHVNKVARDFAKEYEEAKDKSEYLMYRQKWLRKAGWTESEIDTIIDKMMRYAKCQ